MGGPAAMSTGGMGPVLPRLGPSCPAQGYPPLWLPSTAAGELASKSSNGHSQLRLGWIPAVRPLGSWAANPAMDIPSYGWAGSQQYGSFGTKHLTVTIPAFTIQKLWRPPSLPSPYRSYGGHHRCLHHPEVMDHQRCPHHPEVMAATNCSSKMSHKMNNSRCCS
ncbi:uncharacterized protein LOC108670965 isoform X2 [Hyalella azteca]|uniref:Uncharacterized protein LOC108670965 isoform X2 n=1 Tax=Hyalella azteca TaxID=294128 RepID=A0A8B7NJW5_HYAAZ|nr:uncharacterized protein LOC108670965 isoform X2 [Hyalella azteca]